MVSTGVSWNICGVCIMGYVWCVYHGICVVCVSWNMCGVCIMEHMWVCVQCGPYVVVYHGPYVVCVSWTICGVCIMDHMWCVCSVEHMWCVYHGTYVVCVQCGTNTQYTCVHYGCNVVGPLHGDTMYCCDQHHAKTTSVVPRLVFT